MLCGIFEGRKKATSTGNNIGKSCGKKKQKTIECLSELNKIAKHPYRWASWTINIFVHDGGGAGSGLDRGLPAGFQRNLCWGQGRLFLNQTFVMWMKRERNRLSESMGSRGHGGGSVEFRGSGPWNPEGCPPPRVPSLARWLVEGIVNRPGLRGPGTPWHRRGTRPFSDVCCPLHTEGGEWDRIHCSGQCSNNGCIGCRGEACNGNQNTQKGGKQTGNGNRGDANQFAPVFNEGFCRSIKVARWFALG